MSYPHDALSLHKIAGEFDATLTPGRADIRVRCAEEAQDRQLLQVTISQGDLRSVAFACSYRRNRKPALTPNVFAIELVGEIEGLRMPGHVPPYTKHFRYNPALPTAGRVSPRKRISEVDDGYLALCGFAWPSMAYWTNLPPRVRMAGFNYERIAAESMPKPGDEFIVGVRQPVLKRPYCIEPVELWTQDLELLARIERRWVET